MWASALATLVGLTVLVAGPALWLRLRHGAAWRWMGLGILSWVLGVGVKVVVNLAFAVGGIWSVPPLVPAAVLGLVSGLTELGAAALFLRGARLSGGDAVAFGATVGSFEALVVGVLRLLGHGAAAAGALGPAEARAFGLAGSLLFLAERGSAFLGHSATRVLVYESLRDRRGLPAAVALAGFALVDGGATYGHAAKWDWSDEAVLGGFLAFTAAVGVGEAAAARRLWAPPRADRSA